MEQVTICHDTESYMSLPLTNADFAKLFCYSRDVA